MRRYHAPRPSDGRPTSALRRTEDRDQFVGTRPSDIDDLHRRRRQYGALPGRALFWLAAANDTANKARRNKSSRREDLDGECSAIRCHARHGGWRQRGPRKIPTTDPVPLLLCHRRGDGYGRADGARRGPSPHHEDQPRHDQRLAARMVQGVRRRGREGFRRPHQERDLSGEPARRHSAAGRRRAVRLDPGLCRPARVHDRCRRPLRDHVGARPCQRHRARRPHRGESVRAAHDVEPRRG